MKHLEQLSKNLGDLGSPPDESLRHLSAYLELLLDWTDSIDLVSPGSPEQLIQRHIRDAFASWRVLDERGLFLTGACLDVGSGAGLPGLVYAALSPGVAFYLCEPRQKRVVFLQEVRRRLGLKNVTVIGKRVEAIEPSECPGVTLVTFRALRPEGKLLESVLKLAPGASIAFVTGPNEVLQLPKTLIAEEIDYSFADDAIGRKIILVKPVC